MSAIVMVMVMMMMAVAVMLVMMMMMFSHCGIHLDGSVSRTMSETLCNGISSVISFGNSVSNWGSLSLYRNCSVCCYI